MENLWPIHDNSCLSGLEAKITTNVSQINRNYRTTKFMENLWSIHDNSCLITHHLKSQNQRLPHKEDSCSYQARRIR